MPTRSAAAAPLDSTSSESTSSNTNKFQLSREKLLKLQERAALTELRLRTDARDAAIRRGLPGADADHSRRRALQDSLTQTCWFFQPPSFAAEEVTVTQSEWRSPRDAEELLALFASKGRRFDLSRFLADANNPATIASDQKDGASTREISVSQTSSRSHADHNQDAKDIERDTLALKLGAAARDDDAPLRGALLGYEGVTQEVVRALQAGIHELDPTLPALPPAYLKKFARALIHAANRTGSGGDAFELLQAAAVPSDQACVVVPTASDKLPLQFQTMNVGAYQTSKQEWRWGLCVRVTAVTLYALVDFQADCEGRHALAQLRATFERDLFLDLDHMQQQQQQEDHRGHHPTRRAIDIDQVTNEFALGKRGAVTIQARPPKEKRPKPR